MDYHKIYRYNTTGSGDSFKEWIIKNITRYDELKFSNKTGKLEGEIGNWYDPYNTELPVFWKDWEQEFDKCWNSYNPPPFNATQLI